MPRMDRREALRFNLNVPVQFFWKNHLATEEVGLGETRDISFRGLFVSCDKCPSAGNAIQAKVMLPSPGGSDLVLRIRANVLRVETTDSDEYPAGFAAVIKKYALERRREERGGEQEIQEILDES